MSERRCEHRNALMEEEGVSVLGFEVEGDRLMATWVGDPFPGRIRTFTCQDCDRQWRGDPNRGSAPAWARRIYDIATTAPDESDPYNRLATEPPTPERKP